MSRAEPIPGALWRCWVPFLTLGCVLVFNCCAAARTLRSRVTDEAGDATGLEWVNELELAADWATHHRQRQRIRLHTALAASALAEQHLCPQLPATLGAVSGASRRGRAAPTEAKIAMVGGESLPCRGGGATRISYVDGVPQATLELSFAESSPATPGPWSVELPLSTWYPVQNRRVDIRLPPAAPLHWKCLACPNAPQVDAQPALGTYRFTWHDLPAVFVTDKSAVRTSLPAGHPRLILSTTDSWTEIGEPLRLAFHAAAGVTDLVQQQAKSLTESTPTLALAITAVRRFVAERPASDADDGWEPRPVEEILAAERATPLDRAVLLSALLATFDIPTRPVLVARDGYLAREVASLGQFSTVWLVTTNGDEIWMDPCALRPGHGLAYLTGRELLDLETGIFESPPAGTPATNVSNLSGSLAVRRDGSVRAELELVLAGTYSPFFPAGMTDTATLVAQLLPGTAATPWRIDCEGCAVVWRELSAEQSVVAVVAESRAAAVGRYWAVHLPQPALSQLQTPRLRQATCLSPMELTAVARERWSIRVELPDELQVVSQPPAALLSNNAGRLSVNSTMIGGNLTFGGELDLPSRLLDRDACLSLHDLRRELGRANNQTVLLRRRSSMPEPE